MKAHLSKRIKTKEIQEKELKFRVLVKCTVNELISRVSNNEAKLIWSYINQDDVGWKMWDNLNHFLPNNFDVKLASAVGFQPATLNSFPN